MGRGGIFHVVRWNISEKFRPTTPKDSRVKGGDKIIMKFSDIYIFPQGIVATASTTTTTTTNESFVFTSSTFSFWGWSGTKAPFSQFSFWASLARKLHFRSSTFSFWGKFRTKTSFSHFFLLQFLRVSHESFVVISSTFNCNNWFKKHLSPAMSCACLLLILDEQCAPRKIFFQRAMG